MTNNFNQHSYPPEDRVKDLYIQLFPGVEKLRGSSQIMRQLLDKEVRLQNASVLKDAIDRLCKTADDLHEMRIWLKDKAIPPEQKLVTVKAALARVPHEIQQEIATIQKEMEAIDIPEIFAESLHIMRNAVDNLTEAKQLLD